MKQYSPFTEVGYLLYGGIVAKNRNWHQLCRLSANYQILTDSGIPKLVIRFHTVHRTVASTR